MGAAARLRLARRPRSDRRRPAPAGRRAGRATGGRDPADDDTDAARRRGRRGLGRHVGGVPARRLALGIAGVAVLAAGGWGVWRWRKQRAADLSGPWSARIGVRGAQSSRDGQQVVLVLEQVGRNLKLTSNAVDIQHDPDWENYRDFWKQRNGTELRRVFYRGEGRILGDDEESEDSADEAASGAAAARAVPVRRVFVGIRIFAPGDRWRTARWRRAAWHDRSRRAADPRSPLAQQRTGRTRGRSEARRLSLGCGARGSRRLGICRQRVLCHAQARHAGRSAVIAELPSLPA